MRIVWAVGLDRRLVLQVIFAGSIFAAEFSDSPVLNDATVGSTIVKGQPENGIVCRGFSDQDSQTP